MQHRAMCHRGKAETAVFLRDDHPKEAVLFQKRPGFRVQICVAMRDLPVVQHVAQSLDRPIQERLFFDRKFQVGLPLKCFPVWPAGKKFALPAYRAGIECDLFCFRNIGQHTPELVQKRSADQLLAPRPDVQWHGDGGKQQRNGQQTQGRNRPGRGKNDQPRSHCAGPDQQLGAVECADQRDSHKG